MSTTATDHLAPTAPTWARPTGNTFAEGRVAYWRDLGRYWLSVGETKLAQDCEVRAIFWEDR